MYILYYVHTYVTHPLTLTTSHAGALFSVIAFTQVVASNISAVVFYFFYPFTLSRGWASGSVFFLMAAIAAIPLPFVM